MGPGSMRWIAATLITQLGACYPDAGFGSEDASFVDGASDAIAEVIDAPPYPCDPAATPDVSGVFVSASGDDGASGKSVSPVKTLAKAMLLAQTTKASHVYLDEGTYPEQIVFASATAVHGGWQKSGAAWARDCRSDARLHTVINPVKARVVIAKGFVGKAEIEDVTLVTNEAKGGPSESIVAIYVSGDGILFHGAALDVTASAGGDGAATTPPADPGPHSCDGHTDCSTGASGGAGPNGSNASAGAFGINGFTVGDGAAGSDGTAGSNGTKGGAGEHRTGCVGCASGCPACSSSAPGAEDGPPGACGCGGNAGKGGPGGHGGGASIGAFIAGKGASLTIDHSTLRAADGGLGSSGVAGPGGSARGGLAGSDKTGFCASSCGPCGTTGICGLTGSWLAGGAAGGVGGTGGSGGKGGGGAGGPSFAAVAAAGATLVVDSSNSIVFGNGGKGADGAPSGAAGATLVVP